MPPSSTRLTCEDRLAMMESGPKALPTVIQKVLLSPELLDQIIAHLDKTDLARLSKVSKFWNWQCARHIWSTCHQLGHLLNVPLGRRAVITPLIRHLRLTNVGCPWEESTSVNMPWLSKLRSVSMVFSDSSASFDTRPLMNMLPETLHEFKLDNRAQPDSSSTSLNQDRSIPHVPWVRTLDTGCSNLRSLTLNVELTPTQSTELDLLLLSANLEELYLGPLLCKGIDDFTVAIILAQSALRILEFRKILSLESLQILQHQTEGQTILAAMDTLIVMIKGHVSQTLTTLVPYLSNLKTLHLAFNDQIEDSPWSPDPAIFFAIGRLKQLRQLHIRIKPVLTEGPDGEYTHTGLTVSDLISLSRLSLTGLSVQPLCAGAKHPLMLHQVDGHNLL